ncbi:hypothetical protein MMC22_003936 [Lobaria immixta]|nr:hypothetical protein [Lobaria immixta]
MHPPLHHPYLDHPEESSIEETLDGIQKLFQSGRFKRFGLSNYDAWEVRRIYNYASSKGYVLPSIFQGHFNAVSRQYEKTLFPLLRELNISFYADFPTAGLILTDTLGTGSTLWDPSTRFGGDKIYNIPGLLKALPEWQNIAEEAGMSKEALAYRWVAYSSILSSEHGDALMIWALRPKTLERVLEMLAQGPLDSSIAEKIDHVWETIDRYRY